MKSALLERTTELNQIREEYDKKLLELSKSWTRGMYIIIVGPRGRSYVGPRGYT